MTVSPQVPFHRVGTKLPDRLPIRKTRGPSTFERGLIEVQEAGPGIWFRVDAPNPHAARTGLRAAAQVRGIPVMTELIDDGGGVKLFVAMEMPREVEE